MKKNHNPIEVATNICLAIFLAGLAACVAGIVIPSVPCIWAGAATAELSALAMFMMPDSQ